MSARTPLKYAFIDALRGYAVLLVITCHTGGMFAELPYPVKKLTNIGWHGVQLFFLVSCVTLMMSWRADERRGTVDPGAFWLRRFFRIAPMYYLAGLLYFVVEPPDFGFDLGQMLSTALFVNAWSPWLIPTVADRWMVVPGGWSIGVEFTFYLVFPLLAWRLRSFRSALLAWAVAVAVGMAANSYWGPGLAAAYGQIPTDNFLYFWILNQFPIFMLGMVLYYSFDYLRAHDHSALVAAMRRYHYPLIALCGVTLVFIAEQRVYTAGILSLAPFRPFPLLMLMSFVFMVCALALFLNPASWLINRAICALGEASFSAYLLHFLVLHQLVALFPAVFNRSATGYAAILSCAVLWAAAVPVTFALSWVTFHVIEAPMIQKGRQLLEWRRARRQPHEASAGGA